MKATFRHTIKNYQILLQNVKKLEDKNVYVGIPAEHKARKDTTKITNAEIGYINEFGSSANNIPARPFLIPSIESNKDKIAKVMEPAFNNAKPNVSLEKAGSLAANGVKAWIRQQKGFAPLKPATIKARQRKRKNKQAGTKALIDTGSLINSINYVSNG